MVCRLDRNDGRNKFTETLVGNTNSSYFKYSVISVNRIFYRDRILQRAASNGIKKRSDIKSQQSLTMFSPPRMMISLTNHNIDLARSSKLSKNVNYFGHEYIGIPHGRGIQDRQF